MPPENEHIPPKAGGPNPAEQNPRPARWPQLGVPKPIATLFSKFPLETLPANPLPATTASGQADNTLYVFTTAGDARAGSPSFNPACLKWQAYLKFAGVGFVTVPSTNHASPSGALPFLIPAMQESSVGASSLDVRLPIPSSKLLKWAQGAGANGKEMEAESLRHEAYLSLIEHRIRDAWLHTLYLTPANFAAVAHPLYLAPSTRSPLVQHVLGRTLRHAALHELLKSGGATSTNGRSGAVDANAIHAGAADALEALSALLGEEDGAYFSGTGRPGLLDAAVFAYTHLLLDEDLGWVDRRLGWEVMARGNLVRHRRRLYKRFFA